MENENDTKVSVKVLRALPSGATIFRAEKIRDMWGDQRTAIVVMWRDNTGIRKGHFCVETADYLGECH
jgi:hypothetical protein